MTERNTGGPAYPQHTQYLSANGQVQFEGPQGGMTLRDYFAAQAMQAMLASPELMVVVTADQVLGDNAKQRISTLAFQYADAMLEARK